MTNGPNQPILPKVAAGRIDQVLQRAVQALDGGRAGDAERFAAEILQANPRHERALYLLGCALVMQGRAGEALVPLENAVRGRRDAEIETMLGIALRAAGRPQDALARLVRATKRQPPCGAAFFELGCLLESLERGDEAIVAFRRGLDVAPMMPQLSVRLGYALLRHGDYAQAKASFARALEISPHSVDAVFGLGRCHRRLGETAAAIECFRQGLARRPNDAETWLALGLCLQEHGEPDSARECLRRAARGQRANYDRALNSLAASGHGRFWLRPSAAAGYFQVTP